MNSPSSHAWNGLISKTRSFESTNSLHFYSAHVYSFSTLIIPIRLISYYAHLYMR